MAFRKVQPTYHDEQVFIVLYVVLWLSLDSCALSNHSLKDWLTCTSPILTTERKTYIFGLVFPSHCHALSNIINNILYAQAVLSFLDICLLHPRLLSLFHMQHPNSYHVDLITFTSISQYTLC